MTTDYGLAKKLGVPQLAINASQNLYKKQQEGQIAWSPQMRELEAFRDTATEGINKAMVCCLALVRPDVAVGLL